MSNGDKTICLVFEYFKTLVWSKVQHIVKVNKKNPVNGTNI